MNTENITTHDIKVGDRITSYGMVLLVDREPHQTRHPVDNAGGITLATAAVIENWADMVAVSSVDRYSTERYIVSLANIDTDNVARWTIQGNGWAQWARIIEAS